MLDDIDWLVDARWIVVDAKEASRASVNGARDGRKRVGAFRLGWSWPLRWRGPIIIVSPVVPSVPHDCTYNFTLDSRNPDYYTKQHTTTIHSKTPPAQHGSSQAHHQGD